MARRLNGRSSPSRNEELPVFERTLANGLRVLVLPRSQASIVVCDLFYPVGSHDEPPGKSGLAHFLEHMLFKGTERFPKGQIDQLAFIAGGQTNAETGEDCTHYWFLFPSDRWELAIQLEADRMTAAKIVADEVEAERQVILEERAREMESPQVRLDQTHQTVAYLKHPYRTPVIGWPEDLARISARDLRAFYRGHYQPEGAVLVLAGDLDPLKAFAKVEDCFGAIRRGPRRREQPAVVEPPQNGRRDFTLIEPEALSRGLLGWHTVPQGHPDAPALDVLADLLGAGRRSRLWQTLVEQEKVATWVDASHVASRRAGQFFIQVEWASNVEPARVERKIARVLAQLGKEGPNDEELTRSRNRLDAGWRWELEDLAGLASGIGHAALRGDWRTWQAEHDAAMATTSLDLRTMIARYLTDDRLTVGWSLPRAKPAGVLVEPSPAVQQDSPDDRPGSPSDAVASTAGKPLVLEVPRAAARLIDYHPRRSVLENGLRVIHERRPDTNVVALELYIDSGWMREAQPGVAALTGRLLDEGTRDRSALDLAAAIEDLGGSLETSSACVSLRIRKEDLATAIEILADVVIRPEFPAEAVDWTKQRIIADIQGDQEDPAHRAETLFRNLIYGSHPLGRDPRGTVKNVRSLTRDDVVAHHRQFFAPDNAFLVVVGDFEPRTLARLVKSHLGAWSPRGRSLPPYPPLLPPVRAKTRRVDHPGEQVHLLIGHLGIPRSHPDFEALVVLDHILGMGPGFSDRLGRIVRDELGLVYAIAGGITDSADLLPGLFRVYAGTTPREVDRVIATITSEIQAMHDGDFSDEEVDRARRYLSGAYIFDFQTVEQRVERLLELERLGLDLNTPTRWPDQIARITPRRVRQAAKTHLHPSSLFRVEFGPLLNPRRKSRVECA